jgi:hypothetical protein
MLQERVDELMKQLEDVLKEERDLIFESMKRDNVIKANFKLKRVSGRGKYKAFHWIELTKIKTGEIYAVSMLSTDIDFKSGNTHTLLGKIQFSKCVNQNGRIGTNKFDEKTERWYFCTENFRDPKIEINSSDDIDILIKKFVVYAR